MNIAELLLGIVIINILVLERENNIIKLNKICEEPFLLLYHINKPNTINDLHNEHNFIAYNKILKFTTP